MFFRRMKRTAEELLGEHLRKEYQATDFGRRYGWWLCLGEKRVADLNYWRWDSGAQFWHEYRVFVFDPAFAEIGYDADRWCQADISLESRYVEGFREGGGILMAPRAGNLVSIRSVHVPESEFIRVAHQARSLP